MEATRIEDFTPNGDGLTVALELSGKSWKIGLQDGKHEKPAIHTVSDEHAAARLAHVVAVVEECRQKWTLPAGTGVTVMYEAGQDGFWILRALSKVGYRALVVDPASIPVERHSRRAKTDRLDVIRLLNSLRGWLRGERDLMHVVRPPTPEAEAQRQLPRDRGQLQKEVEQHRDRMRKLLRTVGCWEGVGATFARRLAEGQVLCYDGAALPEQLRQRLVRECERLELVATQLAALERDLVRQLPPPVQQRIATLSRLKGIGQVGAMRLVLELFWRDFNNRKQVGACVGLAPQPHDSGLSEVDQGISKQGNRRVRALLVEMAWFWLRYQPDSALARWFAWRTAGSARNKRARRIVIVAVARKLTIALWHYLKDGLVPEGAAMKAAN
jgi:transposase